MTSIVLTNPLRSKLSLKVGLWVFVGVATVSLYPITAQAQWTTNGNNINNTNTANVGIGTTAPTQKLEVAGAGLFTGATVSGNTAAGVYIFDQNIASLNGSNARDLNIQAQSLRFFTGTTYAEKMRIDLNGNVGIGTPNPDNPLTVRASGSSTLGFMLKNYALTQNLSYIGPRGSGGSAQNQGFLAVVNQGSTTVALDSAGPSYFTGGNLGVGTTAPADLLEINSTIGWGFRVRYAGDGQYLRVSANQLSAYTAAGTPKELYLNVDGGNVGIGTSSALTEKLHVAGDGKFTGNLNVSGTIEGGNIKAKYQDLAEWVPSSEQLAAGTVVVLDTTKSNQVVSSTVAYDTRVAGVISAQPGITLGERGEDKVLVATTGRVRVKADASRGPIRIGDLLVTSDLVGVAMKSEAVNLGGVHIHRPGTIIGKALEPLAKGSGEILVLLSLQ